MIAPPGPDIIDQVVLGRYRVVHQLAHGGMGAVYLGRTEGAEGFARPVVIKRILPWLTNDRDIAQMFVREARILSNLHHPNIVSVLDFGRQPDGSYLMVLDYVHGYELAHWHSYVAMTRGRVPVEHALHIVCQVLDALHYAHTLQRSDGKALGIIHRDVTPTNVYLSEQGAVKLLDFGIALVVDEERKYTGRNEVRGKLPYLPAEVCAGSEPSASGDVYAAGVMLYELLTGVNPFDGRKPVEIFRKILEAKPLPVCSIRRDAPEQLDPVIARAMDRDLSVRFKTAAEFAQALRAVPRRADDVIAAELSAQLRKDFHDMPGKLGVASLTARDQAWRGTAPQPAAATVAPARPVSEGDDGAVDDDESQDTTLSESPVAPAAERTLCADVPAEVIEQAKRSSPPPPALSATARPHAAAPISLSRLLVVAAAAGLFGAVAVLLTWIAVARPEPVRERMVVISKESAAPEPQPSPQVRAQTALPLEAATATATDAAAPLSEPSAATERPAAAARAPAAARPAIEPDATTLSHIFARRQRSVQSCFAKHAGNSTLPQVSIHCRVASTGVVDSARIDPEMLADQPLGRCLLEVARRTRFGALQRAVSFHIPISAERVLGSAL